MATNYPTYFFDTRTDSPRQKLAEVLASPNVSGGSGGGGFSSGGAVRSNAQGATLGDGFGALVNNFMKTREYYSEKAKEENTKKTSLEARQKFLIDKGVAPEQAGVIAQDSEAFKSTVDQLTKDARTQVINGTLYTEQTDGSWKPTVTAPDEKTNFEKEYEFAVSQGFKGTPDEWKKSGSSSTTVNTGDAMKLTESQSKDVSFYSRGRFANKELDGIDEKLTSFGENAGAGTPIVGNYLKSPEYRQAERAGRDFLAVILRKDSGAAITKDEVETYGQIYLPLPGDDPKTLENKRSARARALQALRSGLGTAKPLADEFDSNFDENYKKTEANPVQPEAGKPADPTSPNKNPVYNPATGNFE